MKYQKLELPGALLVDGFSIYLIEVQYEGANYYYVGMTGDGHYRSARAGFYRLVGHLEYQNKRSTQNQLSKALMRVLGCQTRKEMNLKIDKAKIIFHHFAIEGFVPDDKRRLATQDNNYRRERKNVLALENALISELKVMLGSRLLNKSKGKATTNKAMPHTCVFEAILGLVK